MKRMWFFYLVLGAALAVGSIRAIDSPTDAVLRADAARLDAMVAGDGAALARLFSDELTFVHSDARVESKESYIRNLTKGDTAYADAKTSDVLARQVAPEVVVLAGRQFMRKKLGETWSTIDLRFLSVWRNEAGEWRMVAWQSARPAGNSVIPAKK